MTSGGLREALVRALLYVGRAVPGRRGFEAITGCEGASGARQMTPVEFKALIRAQHYMLRSTRRLRWRRSRASSGLDGRAARRLRDAAGGARYGALGDAATERLGRAAALFGLETEPATFVPRSAGGAGVLSAEARVPDTTPVRSSTTA